MATNHGIIGEFQSAQESWQSYVERLQQYFVANDVKSQEKQRAVLLSAVGAQTYQLIRNLLAPTKPTDVSFAEIVDAMQKHIQPLPSVIVQRFNFHSRARRPGETVSAFVAELRKHSEHCAFRTTLNDMLRDRLVCGILDQRIQRRLLAEPDLSFDKALELSVAAEAAERNTRELDQGMKPPSVHKLAGSGERPCRGGRAQSSQKCYRCGGEHKQEMCRFKDSTYHHCGKRGHIAKVCRSRRRGESSQPKPSKKQHQKTHCIEDATEDNTDDTTYNLFAVTEQQTAAPPLMVEMKINQASLSMEIDTGASVSLISQETYKKLWPTPQRPRLQPSARKLRTYTGAELDVQGSLTVDVTYGSQQHTLPLLVVAGTGPSLLGRDWLLKIQLDWRTLHLLRAAPPTQLQAILNRHSEVFKEELGCMKGVTATIVIDPQAQPRFCKPRTVPFALRSKVESELSRLERAGVIEPVQFSTWAAPIGPVLKQDGSLRICGDYKVTVNRAAKTDCFPLPRIDDLFASLSGGKAFSKLDLAHAYQQLQLDEDSKKLVVINTHKGLFRYNRLPFGVSAAPAIFQRTIEGVLQGIPNVCVYLDDILITGQNAKEQLENLRKVLSHLEEAGMRLKRSKCAFLLPAVEYLGHHISADGLRPTEEKIRAIVDAPAPQDVTQLRAFLGLINYYGKFVGQLSSILAPLYRLLEKNTKWVWGQSQQTAFQTAKNKLTSAGVLTHFNPEQKIILSCDASPYGVGAVISHQTSEGEKPIAFASRSLSPAEKKYAHLDKEGLAIIFRVKKFHDYLFGRQFQIRSDHKPLQHIFDSQRPIPALASARLQRWALTLSAYDYTITYKPGKEHANADSLSRLPLPQAPLHTPPPGDIILLMETLQASPITATQVRLWTSRDPCLSRIRTLVREGWVDGEEEYMAPFNRRRDELSVQDGCVLWGNRVVIPEQGKSRVLQQLHDGHPGVTWMKSIARSLTWWPGIDKDIERTVQNCQPCQQHQKSPAPAPLHSWEWPDRPWVRLHIDHAGPFLGRYYLLVTDAHSKWIEIKTVPSTATQHTIQHLRSIFATHGLPEILVSDNGTCFTSSEFREFMERNGIRHLTSAPYHPATNGLVERTVLTFKNAMRKANPGDVERALTRFLFHYRNTPHSTTGVTPAELLLGRQPRTHNTLLRPSISDRVKRAQHQQKVAHAKERAFSLTNPVYVKNFSRRGPEWLPGEITKIHRPYSFTITLTNGQVMRRHIEHIRSRTCNDHYPGSNDVDYEFLPSPQSQPPMAPQTETLRRSSRTRNVPDRFM